MPATPGRAFLIPRIASIRSDITSLAKIVTGNSVGRNLALLETRLIHYSAAANEEDHPVVFDIECNSPESGQTSKKPAFGAQGDGLICASS